jgi:hypothetical protein
MAHLISYTDYQHRVDGILKVTAFPKWFHSHHRLSVPGPENVWGEGRRPVRRRFVGNYMLMRKNYERTRRIYLILILRRGSPFPVGKPKEYGSLMWATGRRITVLNERGNC